MASKHQKPPRRRHVSDQSELMKAIKVEVEDALIDSDTVQ